MRVFFCVVLVLIALSVGATLGQQNQNDSESSSHEADGTNVCSRTEGCRCDRKVKPVTILCESMHLKEMYEQNDWLATFEALGLETNETLQLSFEDNDIKEIDVFPPMPVQILSLRNNQIKFIENNAFTELKQLDSLDLSQNRLNELVLLEGVFFGQYINATEGYFKLPIRHLNLSHNGLHSLDKKVFDHLTNLITLDVSHNPLKTLAGSTSMAISSLRKLEFLNLAFTQVSSMHEGMLQDLKFLSAMDLSGNEFTTVPPELRNTHQLKVLLLDYNKFEVLDNKSFLGLEFMEDLSLRHLDRLISVEAGTFGPLKVLEKLDLSFCKRLEMLSDGAFMGIVKNNKTEWPVKDIRLNDNGLTIIEEGLANWEGVDYIDIRNNPFRCDCNLEWMMTYLMPKIDKIQRGLAIGIECAQPKLLRGKPLVELMMEPELFARCTDSKDDLFPDDDMSAIDGSYKAAGLTLMIIGLIMCVMGVAAVGLAVIKRRAIAKALVAHQEIRYERAESDDDGIGSMGSVHSKNRRTDVF